MSYIRIFQISISALHGRKREVEIKTSSRERENMNAMVIKHKTVRKKEKLQEPRVGEAADKEELAEEIDCRSKLVGFRGKNVK
ncbi:hypothetical protein ACTXT7_006324 [Hymenolepis weldensis]